MLAGGSPRIAYPAELPVSGRRDEIVAALRDNQVLVVAGETGSGKTTQLPKMCVEAGCGTAGRIGHTQPRRIAARTVAERLAEEMAVPLGGFVGYAVRFTDEVSEETVVKVMTDGLLLAEIRRDRRLAAYDTVIVDEAHERSLNIDFLLGYLTRLLPRRPELKVVITSATIDTARFAAHFDAPVIEVSGRSHPVEVRYRAPEEWEGLSDEDPLVAAVEEALASTPGDVLVFLPGERDIRDAAEALRRRDLPGVELLPLYARLSAAEQHRAFQTHRARRVVLATNVAETSLTVPGIGSVVDTGLARVSRYNTRTKVQRLQIETVSQASARQRAGRCGRLGPGVCIRLYSEQDYEGRPEYTDPEILRTNLAAVILQMAAADLGPVEDFPFLQPPDRRRIADGRALLEEIGALSERGGRPVLTRIGRRLADLPLDPRLARMVVEAERRGCLREVTVIVAALSVQDPRERPAEDRQEAERLHARFDVPGSDFLGYVALWDYLAGLQADMSGNQFAKRCRSEYLNFRRIREWQDVVSQVRQVWRSAGGHANREPADGDSIHMALLAGLLSHLGVRDRARGDYQGARGARWQIARYSVASRRPPEWAMAAELVETGRTWARTVAGVEPAWAEQLGAHLVKRSYTDPWWDPRRGEALCEERVSLYGLPLVAGRRMTYARIDAAGARALFIEKALVERDWSPGVPALEATSARIEQIRVLEERVRRRDLLADPEAIAGWYDARLPADVHGGRRFEKWWRRAQAGDPGFLDVPFDVLLDRTGGPVDLAAYPDTWSAAGTELALRYLFDPTSEDDGVTAHVPILVLGRLRQEDFDWGVPGYREELLAALVRLLPRPLRRQLPSTAEVAADLAGRLGPDDGPMLPTVARALSRLAGEEIDPRLWDRRSLPAHLRFSYEVLDTDGRGLGRGRDLGELQEVLAGVARRRLGEALAGALPPVGPVSDWAFAEIPAVVTAGMVEGYPTLVDHGDGVSLAVAATRAEAAEGMWSGVRRLLLLAAPLPWAHVERRLPASARAALATAGRDLRAFVEDCAVAVIDDAITAAGGPPRSGAAYASIAAEVSATLAERAVRVATIAAGVLGAATSVLDAADRLEFRDTRGALAPSLDDVRAQVSALVADRFVSLSGTGRLRHLLRYVKAAARRLERLPGDRARDRDRQAVLDRLSERHRSLVDAHLEDPDALAELARVRWMLEELRVSLWAQDLGTDGAVSEARILRTLESVDPLPAPSLQR